jgi:uncharacterized integral membrane protein (TIGR00698 family)
VQDAQATPSLFDRAARSAVLLAPGLLLATAVAIAVMAAAPLVARGVAIPAMVLALLVGIALNPLSQRPLFKPGLVFCVQHILRWSVALLGLRIALGEIAALGVTTLVLTTAAMAITIAAGFLCARLAGQPAAFGALAGAGTAVCGASAALATASVLPAYKGKEADVVFVVVAVNALSTAAMVLYPPLCIWLGFNDHTAGILFGATIHDVAQVVGAGYSVSDTAGNTAVIVKLYRVFLLLPVVLALGWWFAGAGGTVHARVKVPGFALAFLALCIVNSLVPSIPTLTPLYAPVKTGLVALSTFGLLVAISALGLGTSIRAIAQLGWRHLATLTGTTLVILAVVTAGLMVMR